MKKKAIFNWSSGKDSALALCKTLKENKFEVEKSKYRKVVQAGIAKWISDFQKGKIVFNSVSDLKQLIELDMYLQKNNK